MISILINSLTSGGAEKVVLTLLQKLGQKYDDLELIFIEKEQFYEIPEGTKTTYLTGFDSLENGFLKMPYLLVCAWRLKKHVKKNNTKIVQSHLLRATFINAFAKMLGSKHHAQVVIHSRINFENRSWVFRIFAKWVYKKILHRADSVISICQVMKNDLDEYLNLKNHPKHVAIYNPHNLNEVKKMSKEIPLDFDFLLEKKYIISVGRLAQGKRLDDLIRAFYNLKKEEVELIFIGNGSEEKELKRLVKELELEKVVHFLGYQPNPYQYLAQADIYVLSSEWEGLPNIIIEAMICGTTVISSDCISGPREIISPDSQLSFSLKDNVEQGTYGILYPVGKVELLTEAMNLLLENEDLCNEFIQKGLERSESFDDIKITQKYIETFPLGLKKKRN